MTTAGTACLLIPYFSFQMRTTTLGLLLLGAFSASHADVLAAAHTVRETDGTASPAEQQARTEGPRDAEVMAPAQTAAHQSVQMLPRLGRMMSKATQNARELALLRAEGSGGLSCWERDTLAVWRRGSHKDWL